MSIFDYMILVVFLEFFSGIIMLSFTEFISIVCQGVMIFGGVFLFILQYLDIKKFGNVDGFFIFVCFNLLVVNIFRIMFWQELLVKIIYIIIIDQLDFLYDIFQKQIYMFLYRFLFLFFVIKEVL